MWKFIEGRKGEEEERIEEREIGKKEEKKRECSALRPVANIHYNIYKV